MWYPWKLLRLSDNPLKLLKRETRKFSLSQKGQKCLRVHLWCVQRCADKFSHPSQEKGQARCWWQAHLQEKGWELLHVVHHTQASRSFHPNEKVWKYEFSLLQMLLDLWFYIFKSECFAAYSIVLNILLYVIWKVLSNPLKFILHMRWKFVFYVRCKKKLPWSLYITDSIKVSYSPSR